MRSRRRRALINSREPEESVQAEDRKELYSLFSALLSRIHTLSPAHAKVLMDVDARLRASEATEDDLRQLREMHAAQDRR